MKKRTQFALLERTEKLVCCGEGDRELFAVTGERKRIQFAVVTETENSVCCGGGERQRESSLLW